MYYFMDCGPKFTGLVWLNAGGIARNHIFPIFDIFSRSGDIRDQSRKLCKIGPNFACFWPPKFLDQDYLIGVDGDHVVKFCGDWRGSSEILWLIKKSITTKTQD